MIDLHMHSTASDGSETPEQLVRHAASLGLEAMALTDHDTIAGLDEAAETAKSLGLPFVRGCELSASTEYGNMHILGLWLPEKADRLREYFARMRAGRQTRNELILKKLRALGINISMDEILDLAKGTPGRPHIAAILVAKGYCQDIPSAFQQYLARNGKAYTPKIVPTIAEAVSILWEAGATVAIAHPLLHPIPLDWLENTCLQLMPHGLSAIEVWHSAHNADSTAKIIAIATRLGLSPTGGSDYHGIAKPNIKIGRGMDNLDIPLSVFENLLAWRHSKGLPC